MIRSGSPAGDWSRVIVKVSATRNCDGTVDLPSNWMNVVKGTSGDVCGVLSALGEAFLSIATPVARRPIVYSIAGFGQNCTRMKQRRPGAFLVNCRAGPVVS